MQTNGQPQKSNRLRNYLLTIAAGLLTCCILGWILGAFLPDPEIDPNPTALATAQRFQPLQTASPACSCSGDLYDCSNFTTRAEAQTCYQTCLALGSGDIHRLDRNNDGQACEALP